jgi:hypothetical protein
MFSLDTQREKSYSHLPNNPWSRRATPQPAPFTASARRRSRCNGAVCRDDVHAPHSGVCNFEARDSQGFIAPDTMRKATVRLLYYELRRVRNRRMVMSVGSHATVCF